MLSFFSFSVLDSTSKIPTGILFSYNFGEMGNFKQCLDAESKDVFIKGKYCLGTISLTTSVTNTTKTQRRQLDVEVYIIIFFIIRVIGTHV